MCPFWNISKNNKTTWPVHKHELKINNQKIDTSDYINVYKINNQDS